MEGEDELKSEENVRRTRSGKVVCTPPTVKPSPKKTRKKAALTEIKAPEDGDDGQKAKKASVESNTTTTTLTTTTTATTTTTTTIKAAEVTHEMECENKQANNETEVAIKIESNDIITKSEPLETSNEIDSMEVKTELNENSKDCENGIGDPSDFNHTTLEKPSGEPDAENISEDELPTVQAVKVPETEEVSDEELPGPKRAELPADTEVVSEDELPLVKKETVSEDELLSVKKEGNKRKLTEGDYDPGSPTSENDVPTKKLAIDTNIVKEDDKNNKPKKLPELDKYWKAVNDDPTDFTGWTYLLQYVDQENDMEAAREAYDAFLSHYPYCYGYWRKYADYEKRKGNKKKCEELGVKAAIFLSLLLLSLCKKIQYLFYCNCKFSYFLYMLIKLYYCDKIVQYFFKKTTTTTKKK